jgi:hypothetical protein
MWRESWAGCEGGGKVVMWVGFGIWLGAFSLFFSYFCRLLLLECHISTVVNRMKRLDRGFVQRLNVTLLTRHNLGCLWTMQYSSNNHLNVPLCTDYIWCFTLIVIIAVSPSPCAHPIPSTASAYHVPDPA